MSRLHFLLSYSLFIHFFVCLPIPPPPHYTRHFAASRPTALGRLASRSVPTFLLLPPKGLPYAGLQRTVAGLDLQVPMRTEDPILQYSSPEGYILVHYPIPNSVTENTAQKETIGVQELHKPSNRTLLQGNENNFKLENKTLHCCSPLASQFSRVS